MNNTTLGKTLIAGGFTVISATASAGLTANLKLTTDYVWRGWSLTSEDPAIQGGLDYRHDSGFYLGIWGSNVDFRDANLAAPNVRQVVVTPSRSPSLCHPNQLPDDSCPPANTPPPTTPPDSGPPPTTPPPDTTGPAPDTPPDAAPPDTAPPAATTPTVVTVTNGDREEVEIDLYGGYRRRIGAVDLDLGLIKYFFEDNPVDRDFTDLFAGATWNWISVRIAERIQGDNLYHAADTYVEAAANVPLPQAFMLKVHVGKSIFDDLPFDPVDYSVGISRLFKGFLFDLSYFDMDSDGDFLYGDTADGRVVFSIARQFRIR